MDNVVATYLAYLAICVPVALFVGWTLHRNGRVFLVEIFEGKEELADSINHLLMVGFYLGSLGFVSLMLDQFTTNPADTAEAIRTAGRQIGIILLVFGFAHLANMLLLGWARKAVLLDPLSERIEARRAVSPPQPPLPPRDPFRGPVPPEALS
jgi:hypothetical protein